VTQVLPAEVCAALRGHVRPLRGGLQRHYSVLEQRGPHGAHSGKHKKHGMNVQVIADRKGRLLWSSPALAGAVHDVRAAREHGIIDALAEVGINCWAEHQGLPGRRRHGPSPLPRPMEQPFRWSAGRQPVLCEGPGTGRTSHCHPQVLAAPPQAPLLDDPDHEPRPSCPHPLSGQLRLRMEKDRCRDQHTYKINPTLKSPSRRVRGISGYAIFPICIATSGGHSLWCRRKSSTAEFRPRRTS